VESALGIGFCIYKFWDERMGNLGELIIREKAENLTNWCPIEPPTPETKEVLLDALMTGWIGGKGVQDREELERRFDEDRLEYGIETMLTYSFENWFIFDETKPPRAILTSWLESIGVTDVHLNAVLGWAENGLEANRETLSRKKKSIYWQEINNFEEYLKRDGLWKPVVEQPAEAGSEQNVPTELATRQPQDATPIKPRRGKLKARKKARPGQVGRGKRETIRKPERNLPIKPQRGKPPAEPKITVEAVGEEAFRSAWCQYKHDSDQYYGAGKAFTHKNLKDKLGMSEQATKNYYNNVWRPQK
jgi:hypothetical protein